MSSLSDQLRVMKVSAIEGMQLKLEDKEDTIIQQSKYFWGIYYYFFKLKKKLFFIDAEIETLLANKRLELKVKKLEEVILALRDELATECVERQELISSKATLQVKLSLAEEKLHSEVRSLENKVAVLEDELRVKSAEAMLKAGCKCRLLLAVSDGELADEGNK